MQKSQNSVGAEAFLVVLKIEIWDYNVILSILCYLPMHLLGLMKPVTLCYMKVVAWRVPAAVTVGYVQKLY